MVRIKGNPMDYYLKADSEETLKAALIDAGIATTDSDGNFVVETGHALCMIGSVFVETGNMLS